MDVRRPGKLSVGQRLASRSGTMDSHSGEPLFFNQRRHRMAQGGATARGARQYAAPAASAAAEPELLSVEEAARLLGISKWTAYDYVRRGLVPGAKSLGRSVKF